MNPSASGWILKFFNIIDKNQLIDSYQDESDFYDALKTTGFLFGNSVKTIVAINFNHLKITKEEYTKINLFHSLLFIFFQKHSNSSFEDAVNNILAFYQEYEKVKIGFLQKLTFNQNNNRQLEDILTARLHETHQYLENKSIPSLTYILLFIDVLAYKKYLSKPTTNLNEYADYIENLAIKNSFLALKSKKEKSKSDIELLTLFDASSTFIFGKNNIQKNSFLEIEKRFILDLCCLAIWDDFELDQSEFLFLKELISRFGFKEKEIIKSIECLKAFTQEHQIDINIFEHRSPINQIYKQSSATVKKIILRNKNRLLKELSESGELLLLLGESSYRELNKEEKHKVKDQLLDICKSVPSLAIFLVPGGSLLLPLLVKYIPSLLPSAFAENRIKKDKQE